ncbi:hypothetical protein DRH27_00600 [Candidatus Falkowbacteria bacterium]|nr:MAG: hypothetical protein DRH27_00600 [Candidatus Falkowbacteria bacterium]
MKKTLAVLAIVGLAMIFVTAGWCGNDQPYRSLNAYDIGNDSYVPNRAIKVIPGVGKNSQIIGFSDYNGWGVGGPESIDPDVLAATSGVYLPEINMWKFSDVAGKRFHPSIFDKTGKRSWAKLEDLPDFMSATWINRDVPNKPCIQVNRAKQ